MFVEHVVLLHYTILGHWIIIFIINVTPPLDAGLSGGLAGCQTLSGGEESSPLSPSGHQ